jgi:anoctamin-1
MSKELQNMDYLDYYYATFKTSDFDKKGMRPSDASEYEYCRYYDFRTGPNSDETLAYKRPLHYWKILAARLAFIIIFQNVVLWLQSWIDWIIPDRPHKLESLIRREKYLVNNKIIQEEKARLMMKHKSRHDVDVINGGAFYEARS